MIDEDSSNYQEGLENNYFLNNGTLIRWWHGTGALLDYSNPAALEWWHNQMKPVLDIGIDGWKCDGTDPYVFFLDLVGGAKGYAGRIDHKEYAN